MRFQAAAAIAALATTAATAFAQTTINLEDGDTVANGTDLPSGATVNVFDGATIGLAVDLSNGTLNIFGGNVAIGATSISSGFTNSNNQVNISGGNVGPFFQFVGSTGNISGGRLNTFGVFSGSTVTITGGTVTGFPDVFSNGTVNIEGGNVNTVRALSGSTINILGSDFALDGEPIDIEPGETITLTARNQSFTATLADGSPFSHELRTNNTGFPNPDIAVTSATINLTHVDVTPPCPGDTNNDNTVDPDDLFTLLANFGATTTNGPADGDVEPIGEPDGTVGPEDLFLLLANFGTSCG